MDLRWVTIVVACGLPATAPGARAPGLQVRSEARLLAGGEVRVALVDADHRQARAAFDAAFAVFALVERDMNEWRPDSSLSLLNARAGRPGSLALGPELCAVLRAGRAGAERTGGLFDPTWAALRDIWRFGTDATGELPSPAAVAARCALVNHRDLEIEARAKGRCDARLARPGMRVGLGGLAKGWGIDEVVRRLRALGVRAFSVQAGGDSYWAGEPGGAPWRVRVRDPRGDAGTGLVTLELRDAAVSTSGDYEHYFEIAGVRYHHLLDPRTCAPARASRAATVVAERALDTEVLVKAVFIAGPTAGLELAKTWGAEALIIGADGCVAHSPGLAVRWQRGQKERACNRPAALAPRAVRCRAEAGPCSAHLRPEPP